MFVLLLCFCVGILAAGLLPVLPAVSWLLLLLPLSLLTRRYSRLRWPLSFVLGLCWGIASGHWSLQQQWPEQWHREDVVVSGRVLDLPQSSHNRVRFWLAVDEYLYLPGDQQPETLPRRLQVTWYGSPESLATDQAWQLRLRLSRPRGMVNPAGFDYQAWLLRQGIGAVGYVREDPGNRLLAELRPYRVGTWRQGLRSWLLDRSGSEHSDLLLALLVGDRSLIDDGRWDQLRRTGTNHLMAISGLHVGFVASLGFLLGLIPGRLLNLFWHRLPARLPAHLLAAFLALGYAALAGFSLPTQRALVMVLVAQWVLLFRRSARASDAWVIALTAVLLLDPLAAWDMGFWLSFGAVAVLLLVFAGRRRTGWIVGLCKAQWAIFIGLLLPLALLLGQISLLAPLANLLAIPLVTMAVVPFLLLSAAIYPLWPGAGTRSLWVAERGMDVLVWWLDRLLALGGDWAMPALVFTPWSLLLAALAVLLILLPRGVSGRWLGYPGLLLALMLPGAPAPPLTITTLDVGQGLAVVVRTPNHTLVYDTGPAYSERFDAGSAIVVPYLRRAGVRSLDKLVISHSHDDHAGGLTGVLRAMPVTSLLLGEPEVGLQGNYLDHWYDCHEAFPDWQWDGVEFRFLRWPLAPNASANDRSCVLLIRHADQWLLLTGDIERASEAALLATGELPEDIQWLQVPHHGSRTSSTAPFLAHTRPRYGVYSSGYRNRHGHPHWQVVERYRRLETRMYNTAHSGAVTFIWNSQGEVRVLERRVTHRRYWYD